MAYAINKNRKAKGGERKGLTGLASSIFGSSQQINKNTQAKIHFYELEAGEVIDIILNKKHPHFRTYRDIGKIKARLVKSQRNIGPELCKWYTPMHPNISDYPCVGEYDVCDSHLGKDFYHGRINYSNDVNHNMWPGLSEVVTLKDDNKGSSTNYTRAIASGASNISKTNLTEDYSFSVNPNLKPMHVKPGDIVYHGRFGQSIKMSSGEGYEKAYKSPNIKIKVGQRLSALDKGKSISIFRGNPIDEDINDDGTSLFMTTDEKVPLTPATSKSPLHYKSFKKKPRKFDGKQIILNSDRLIFNSREKEFLCFAKKSQYFCTDDRFLVDSTKDMLFNTKKQMIVTSPKIFLGSKEAKEPVVLGKQLQTLLEEIINTLTKSQFINGAGPASMNPGNVAQFSAIKSKLKKMLSPQNKTL